jgi:hypothetical protein
MKHSKQLATCVNASESFKHFFNLLPSDQVREEYMENISKESEFEVLLKSTYKNMSEFVGSAFMWINTKQGTQYWSRISLMK